MIADARDRLAETLSEITGQKFEANNESGYLTGESEERGIYNIYSDKEALDLLVKETTKMSKMLAKAMCLVLLLAQDEGGG